MIEDRLRAAFTALADTVDTPPPGLRRPTHRARAVVGAAAAVLIVTGGAWVAFQPSQPGDVTPPPTAPPAASSVAPPPVTVPYELYTHCGIDEARIGALFYEAEQPIPGPPNDWGNPYQQGTMTLISANEVVFHDDAGHVVRFRLRPGATTFKRVCQ